MAYKDADHERGTGRSTARSVANPVVRCDTCGDVIHNPDSGHIHKDNQELGRCNACLNPRCSFCGNTNSGHFDDDPSGVSASWDIAVRMYEDG